MPFITGLIMGAAITVFLILAAIALVGPVVNHAARRMEEGDQ